jgi:hypothetical protein
MCLSIAIRFSLDFDEVSINLIFLTARKMLFKLNIKLKQDISGSHGIEEHIFSRCSDAGHKYIYKEKQITPRLETGILELGHYHREIYDQESTIMFCIKNFGFWPDQGF